MSNDKKYTRFHWFSTAILILAMLIPVFQTAPVSAQTTVTLSIVPTEEFPGLITVPININGLTTTTLAFRVGINVPDGLAYEGIDQVGTLTAGATLEQNQISNGDGSYRAIVAATNSTQISGAGAGVLFNLLLRRDVITEQTIYPLALRVDLTRVNDNNGISLALNNGTVTVKLIPFTGQVTSWDGQNVNNATVTLSDTSTVVAAGVNSPSAVITTTNTAVDGSYELSLGQIYTITQTINKANLGNPDNWVTELDAREVLRTAVLTSNCPVLAGDVNHNGMVTELDAREMLRYAVGLSNTVSPTTIFTPNDVVYPGLRATMYVTTTGYYEGDCTGNYLWGQASVMAASTDSITPEVEVDGSMLTIRFPQGTYSTRFAIKGLTQGQAAVRLITPAAEAAALSDFIVQTDAMNAHGGIASKASTVAAFTTGDTGFTIQIKLYSSIVKNTEITIEGRTDEGPNVTYGPFNVVPEQRIYRLNLPLINMN